MWKKILEAGASLLTITRELEQNRADIKEMRRDLLSLTLVVQRLSDEIKMSNQHESAQREKLTLQIQNELLKFERGLSTDSRKGRKQTVQKVLEDEFDDR